MRLTDADVLEEKVEHDYHHKKIDRYDRDLLLHYLDVEMAPTIEPQPIVRCKGCKYADEDVVCQNDKGLAMQDDDDFCSFAERKDGGADE